MKNRSDLHILVIATWYPHGKDKLIGIYHKHFCQALAKTGVKVNMLHVDRQAISLAFKYPFMKKAYEEACEGYTTYFQRMLNVSRISFDLQVKLYTKRLEKLYYRYEKIHGKPDVLHAQVTVPAGYAACVLAKKLGIPVVITEHATYFQRFMSGKEGKYAKYALENTAALTCVGKFMQEIYSKEYGLTAQLLPNIVNCAGYRLPRKERGPVLRFTSVCALRDSKRIDFAVQALKTLRDKNAIPQFQYTVVGDGYYAEQFKAATRQMQMDDCVSFVGQKNTEEIAQILADTDILLVASDVETFCIPAVEGLAAGVPVVSTKCGGPEDFLTPECSELCEVDDPASMADAILRLVNRLDSLDEDEIRQTAMQFDGEAVAEKAISIYESILK